MLKVRGQWRVERREGVEGEEGEARQVGDQGLLGTQIHKSPTAGEEGPRDRQTQVLVKGWMGEKGEGRKREGRGGERRGGETGGPKQKYS